MMTEFVTPQSDQYNSIKSALLSGQGRSTLLAGARYPWLQPFDQTFDDRIADYLSDLLHEHANPYDPMPVEDLVSDVSAILNRCMLYRREIYDLEAQAVRQALDYELFTKQWSILKDLDLADQIEKGRAIDQTTQKAASKEFSHAEDPGLAAGFSKLTEGGAMVAAEAVAGEQNRKNLVTQKYQLLRDYQGALESRHISPGNALNFGERLERLLRFVRQDIRIAYLKVEAAEVGLVDVFGIARPAPKPDAPQLIDLLVNWARAASEDLAASTSRETVFERVFSLRVKVTEAEYQEGTRPGGAGFLLFSLDTDFFPLNAQVDPNFGQRYRPRLLGLAASFAARDFDDPKVRQQRLTIALFPPSPLLDIGPYRGLVIPEPRPPVVLSNVGITNPELPPRWVLPESAKNIDPSARYPWALCVSTEAGSPNAGTPVDFDPAQIIDIRIHVLVGMRAVTDFGEWKHFSW